MLIEEAEKGYNKLTKELVDESVSDYAFSTSPLPMLSHSDEKERKSSKTNSPHLFRVICIKEEHRFIRSEIDNEDQR